MKPNAAKRKPRVGLRKLSANLRLLEFFREGEQDKHLRDVRFMLAATPIDRTFVAAEAARLGLTSQWQRVQQP
jgi:hypothetical protein